MKRRDPIMAEDLLFRPRRREPAQALTVSTWARWMRALRFAREEWRTLRQVAAINRRPAR